MKLPRLRRSDPPADVTLLLEGTFPMVRGGVSSWVVQLMEGLPDFRFAAVFLGSREYDYEGLRYDLPDNLVHLEIHYLMDLGEPAWPSPAEGNAEAFDASDALHDYFKAPESGEARQRLTAVAKLLERPDGLTESDFLHSEQSWDQITDYYRRYCTDPSFVDYFWSVRNMHAPLFKLARIAHTLPPSRCLHSISTGYAGLLGALGQSLHGRPFTITEHGIYTKERQIDLAEARWIRTPKDALSDSLHQEMGYIRVLWVRFFEGLGRLAYSAADPVVSLYEGNRRRQIKDGAEAERTRVIPNGIRVDDFRPLRRETGTPVPPVVGLVGRLTPIKDIKTFIRAMHTVCKVVPEAVGRVIGPEDEDPEYAAECWDLVRQLGLEGRVEFRDFQPVEETLDELGVLALSSISEAQPLVILEAMAAGLPVVCTDVGACSELVLGGPEEREVHAAEYERDAYARAAGRIVPIADPEVMADSILDLLRHPDKWEKARRVGIERVETWYTEELMFEHYEALYREVLGDDAPAAGGRRERG